LGKNSTSRSIREGHARAGEVQRRGTGVGMKEKLLDALERDGKRDPTKTRARRKRLGERNCERGGLKRGWVVPRESVLDMGAKASGRGVGWREQAGGGK